MTAQEDKSDRVTHNRSDFSIEHILNRAGSSTSVSGVNFNINDNSSTSSAITIDPYSWLQCTRYCPPKVPRTQKRDGPQKRQLGRHPRIPFTSHQLSVLEEKFQKSPYLSSEEVIMLSRQLQLADVRVKIWFQNRRARERREKLQCTNKNLENKKEMSATTTSVANTSAIRTDSEPNVFHFLPLQTTYFTNHLLPLPVSNRVHCTSEENS